MRLALHQLPDRAEALLAKPRARVLHVRAADPLLRPPRSVYGDDTIDGVNGSAYLLAGMLGYGVAATAFAGLAIMTVIRREDGVLKRLRGTPLPAWAYVSLSSAPPSSCTRSRRWRSSLLGRVLFDIPFPDRWLSLVLTLLLGGLAFAALGLGLTGVIKSAEGSSAVVNAIYLPMAFISGSFFSSTPSRRSSRRSRPSFRSRTSSSSRATCS